jgi:hypothetical protein
MGRGLSPLQRYIVNKAGGQKRVYYAEILEGFFGWQPRQALRRYQTGDQVPVSMTEKKPVPPERVGLLSHPGDRNFSAKAIGEKVYRKTMAVLSRSCRRLADRGLVDIWTNHWGQWPSVEITDKGREWLSVNQGATSPSS